jgi:hypothetical protein
MMMQGIANFKFKNQITTSVKINNQNYTRGKEIFSPFEYLFENNHQNQANVVDSA